MQFQLAYCFYPCINVATLVEKVPRPSGDPESLVLEVTNALGLGTPILGRLVVRSFKGRVNVSARSNVEGGKPKPTP